MQVTVISDTIQEFDGVKYYLCGFYFQHNGKRLHRAVWEANYGSIPKDCDIHHKDQNRSNNSIENLELVKREEHHRYHMSQEERKVKSRENLKIAREYADKWHGSPEGIEFHKKLGRESWKNRVAITYKCTWCGKEFESRKIYPESQNRFCHPNHKAAYRRWRLKNESIVC